MFENERTLDYPYHMITPDEVHHNLTLRNDHFLEDCRNALGCDYIEFVYVPGTSLVMLIDECGRLKSGWKDNVNWIASGLYAGTPFGNPIVGNVIFAHLYGDEIYPLTDREYRVISALEPYHDDNYWFSEASYDIETF